MDGLKDKDCALVIHEDMTTEIIIPTQEDETANAPDNVVLLAALATALSDEKIVDAMFAAMDKAVEEAGDKV